MKVLTIQEPWASLLVLGHKKIETRSWATKYRGPLLIHASASRAGKLWRIAREEPFKQYLPQYDSVTTIDGTVKQTDVDWSALPFGAIIGQVNLVDVVPTSHILHNMDLEKSAARASVHEEAFGDYSPGRYGWLLSDPILFGNPIPAKGKLGLWDHKGDILLR